MRIALYWALLVLFATGASDTAAREFFVAQGGDDAVVGDREAPLATLEGARDAVRRWRAQAGRNLESVTVWIQGGCYFRKEPFVLGAADSGTDGAPVIYRAWGDRPVRLIGGLPCPASWFTSVTQASDLWARIDPKARGRLLQADLRARGVDDYGRLEPRGYVMPGRAAMELFHEGEPLPLARWPNDGFVKIAGAPAGPQSRQFMLDDNRMLRWLGAPAPWVTGYFQYAWADSTVAVSGIDPASRIISVTTQPAYGIAPNASCFFLNMLEELDQPGEWYIDRTAGILYLWPPGPLGDDRLLLSTLDEELVRIQGARNVTLQGLTLEVCRGDAVTIEDGRDVTLQRCVIRNSGEQGVRIEGGSNVRIEQCEISGCGAGGVWLNGGDRKTLEAARHVVSGCRIHHFSRWRRTCTPGIELGGVGCSVLYNEISDAPHIAILYRGNEHRIENNRIHHVCLTTDDAGAIYTGRDWCAQGNVIRFNLIHDIRSSFTGAGGVHAIYLDDCASGNLVHGNVVKGVGGFGVLIGGGRDNTIENNIFVQCGKAAIHLDARGERLINDAPGNTFNLRALAETFQITRPPWSTRYPRLARLMEDGYEEAKKPKGNLVARNQGWKNQAWLHENMPGTLKYLEQQDNLPDADPMFANEKLMDLRLLENSPARRIPGFTVIPVDAIGAAMASRNVNEAGGMNAR